MILKYYYFLQQSIENVKNMETNRSPTNLLFTTFEIFPSFTFARIFAFLHPNSKKSISSNFKSIQFDFGDLSLPNFDLAREKVLWDTWFDFGCLRLPQNRNLQFHFNLVTDGVKVSVPFIESSLDELLESKKGKQKRKRVSESKSYKDKKKERKKQAQCRNLPSMDFSRKAWNLQRYRDSFRTFLMHL